MGAELFVVPPELDALSAPLEGINLIEASAGTGKTFSIASLYLRALLTHRIDGQPLDVRQLLVVTFSEAATRELKDRIRRRLREALRWLADGKGDPTLAPLLAPLAADEAMRAAAVARLEDQLRLFDEAAIFTIHGFCRRVLQESAFETGSLFDVELVQRDGEVLQEVVEDAWRRWLASEPADHLAYLLGKGVTPARLVKELRLFVGKPYLALHPAPVAAAGETRERLDAAYWDLRTRWRQDRETVVTLLAAACDPQAPVLRQKPYQTRWADLVSQLDAFLEAERIDLSAYRVFEDFRYLTRSALQDGTLKKAAAPTPDHPVFGACERLAELADAAVQTLEHWLLALKRRLFESAAEELRRRKRQRRVQGFDDLLLDLRQALARSEELAALLHRRFPLALIDEFQDTDPVQFGIFEAIYRPRGGTLFLIGDPKQAIYSFRGGDIFTYMRARRFVASHGRAYTLATNWRSSPALIRAVNTLFGNIEKPFGYEDIAFYPVKPAAKDHAELKLGSRAPAPLTLWLHPERLNADAGRSLFAEATADEIQRLLCAGESGQARLGERPLLAQDIAVLVRSHKDARLMRETLRRRGIRSVEYSQDSLFDTPEAEAVEQLLRAVLEPGEEGYLRAALANPLLGRSAVEIDALQDDELAWEALIERFNDYHALWLARGFAAMFGALLQREEVAERLMALPGGERRLTNVLHLHEVLQQAAQERAGPRGLLLWLNAQRDPERRAGDADQLRLESDEGLVKIVTVHKSKGLQYPVVFCPFLWTGGEAIKRPFLFHEEPDAEGECGAGLELGGIDLPEHETALKRHRQAADQEAAAEAMRLAYVALTRAEHKLYLAWGPFGGRGTAPDALASPLGRLLNLGDGWTDAAHCRSQLAALAERSKGAIEVREPPQPELALPMLSPGLGESLSARRFQGRIPRDWRIASFTGLHQGRHAELPDYDDVDAPAEPEPVAPERSIMSFPRGARAGVFLHKVLELIDFSRPEAPELGQAVRRWLPRHGLGLEWAEVAAAALRDCLRTSLDGRMCLADVRPAQRLVELEFHYPLGRVTPAGLARVFAGRLPGDLPARLGRLEFSPQRGFMKGYIDLVFQHDGRYYLADYKSNYLGPSVEHYRRERLPRVMGGQYYDLQYYIYAVALHRYLARRLVDYDYERHFGGVYYLFLRGMRPALGPACGVYHRRPERSLIEALDAYLVEGEEGASC